VRTCLQKDPREDLIFPIEIGVGHDRQGKLILYGHERLKGVEVSIAHKGSEAVVIVADEPVGIDIEKI
jgi:phosphopantetheinyl transferase